MRRIHLLPDRFARSSKGGRFCCSTESSSIGVICMPAAEDYTDALILCSFSTWLRKSLAVLNCDQVQSTSCSVEKQAAAEYMLRKSLAVEPNPQASRHVNVSVFFIQTQTLTNNMLLSSGSTALCADICRHTPEYELHYQFFTSWCIPCPRGWQRHSQHTAVQAIMLYCF